MGGAVHVCWRYHSAATGSSMDERDGDLQATLLTCCESTWMHAPLYCVVHWRVRVTGGPCRTKNHRPGHVTMQLCCMTCDMHGLAPHLSTTSR